MQVSSALATLGKRHRNQFENAGAELQQEFMARTQKQRAREKWLPFYDILLERTSSAASGRECAGDRRLKELREILDQFKFDRSPDQCKFHEDFIVLCLQHIYKEDYEPNRTRLMQEFGIDSTKVGSLITTPRRWGKTTSVAMFIAAMMMVCEGLTIATFAPGQRASTGLKTKVLEKMCELPDKYQSRILPDSKELCSVIVPSMMDSNGQPRGSIKDIIQAKKVNRLFAYPGSTDGGTLSGHCVGRPTAYGSRKLTQSAVQLPYAVGRPT